MSIQMVLLCMVALDVHLRTETSNSVFTGALTEGEVLRIPVAHGEGNYFASEELLDELEAEDRVAFRYCDSEGNITKEANPNGASRNIAGILNAERNVLGMMPHPERVFRSVQMSWAPSDWPEDSGWMRLFRNARVWVN